MKESSGLKTSIWMLALSQQSNGKGRCGVCSPGRSATIKSRILNVAMS
jgi:hypothetical protein